MPHRFVSAPCPRAPTCVLATVAWARRHKGPLHNRPLYQAPLPTLPKLLTSGRHMMKTKLPRRKFVRLAAAALALPAIRHAAWAQTYPTRPVLWLLGFAPGGPNDVLARLLGQHLSEKLGQPFVIESRPGAGGNLATQAVANAAPDGHTLLGIGHFNAINTTLYKQLPFDFMRDIVPVAGIAQAPNVLMVHPSVPATTVTELIAYLKANP